MEVVVLKSDFSIIRTYMKDYYDILNPKYFNQFHKIIVTKVCFKKTHNKSYSIVGIPTKNVEEFHKIYNIVSENIYQTLLTKLSRFTMYESIIINPQHDDKLMGGIMLKKFQFNNIVVHYYAKLISQIFRYKYPDRNYNHIEKFIQEFLY